MYYLPTSCLFFYFLFSLFHPLPCSSSKQGLGWCEAQFQCGNITAGFPFWGGNRPDHCGHPWLKLHCNNNITSLFIFTKEYSVFHLNQKSNTLTLARAELLSSFCSSLALETYLPPAPFELSQTYKILSVFYHCNYPTHNHSSYKCPEIGPIIASENLKYHETCLQRFDVNVPTSFVPEEKELNITNLESVLRKGFDVKVKIDMKPCQECSSSHGFCSFRETFPYEFKCIPRHPPTANELHRRCSGTFSCGDQRELFYPFWIPGREDCGLPDFKLNCSGGFAELSISSVIFRVLATNYDSGIIRLARIDYINDPCPQDSSNTPIHDYVLPFAPTTDLLTIYYNCDGNFSHYVSTYVKELDCGDDERNFYVTRNLSSLLGQGTTYLNDFKGLCRRSVSIPASRTALNTLERTPPSTDNLKKALEDGFELRVNLDCRMCIQSGGACGYNQTQAKIEFVCYCIDEPHNSTCDSRKKGLSTKAKAGIAAGALGLVMLILGFCLLIGRRKKTSEDSRQQYLKALIPLKHYSYVQLDKITKSFAEVVGKGGFGTVYRGILCDGRSVAVKILKESQGNGEDFINEVASMSKTSHVNIVTLLGFCSEGSKRAIVYEFMENGSLDKFISSKRSSNMDWKELYKISLGVARGLEYLHHGCRTRIVHFDIKPQNVLLDDNLFPKVSDFGLAKLCEKKESIMSLLDTRGTIGYIAPELFSRMYGRVSHKSDVYSYGMLVLEMIGARNKPSTEDSASNPSSMYFPEWIYKDLENQDNGRLIENGINSEEEEIARKMTLVGLWCIQSSPSDRPPMDRVVEMMEGNLNALEVPPRPVFQIPAAPLQESSTISENISAYTEVCSINIA